MKQIENLNIESINHLPSPGLIKEQVPSTIAALKTIYESRKALENIIDKKDNRLLVVIGPCSIHDTTAAMEYAQRLKKLDDQFSDQIKFIMRVYFEKPRTTLGWKGLINDPYIDQTYKVEEGLKLGRTVLRDIAEVGLGTATEMLDTMTPQYLADLVCWGAIGARTVESQPHREMSSGLSMPIGFKNATTGDISVAINAVKVAVNSHHFLGANQKGELSLVKTKGNKYSHLILRGGSTGPNYDPTTIKCNAELLSNEGLCNQIMIDCSHGNSKKKHQYQADVIRNVTGQIQNGNQNILGLMIESNLFEGNQSLVKKEDLKYGLSITDECIGWDTTVMLMDNLYTILKKRA
tara:strand:- start:233 stop:1282 length:1050 start_codon:yes stop_codon:yes gene_type:complete